jgi:hypothetical protein
MSFANVKGSIIVGSNKIFGSSLNTRLQDPHKIGYPDGWRKGKTEEWYKSQQTGGRTTRFTHLQYRKEREKPFHHEFIVVELENGTVCRFDRRGDVDTRAHAFTSAGITAEDTAHVIQKDESHYKEIYAKSDLLLRLYFPQGQDLLTILGICYGVQHDEHARAYTLLRYNCYFLSWTIVTATVRRTVDWALLGKEGTHWEALVKSTIDGLTPGPSRLNRLRAFIGMNVPDPSAQGDPVPFIGSAYLISTLRKALIATRASIHDSLAGLILRSTVSQSMIDIAQKSAQQAASEAARNHASQAARDAAMEAVIESMWRTILASENGGQIWEARCKATEECVWRAAAAAAADAAEQHQLITPPATPPPTDSQLPTPTAEGIEVPVVKASWEVAWDAAWADNWYTLTSTGRARSNSSASRGSDAASASISQRAKAAWDKAWTDAVKANTEYVPLVSHGVADYVMKNLPEALPEVLKIDTSVRTRFINCATDADGFVGTKLDGQVHG